MALDRVKVAPMIEILQRFHRSRYCGILQGCLRMTTTALQQLTIFTARRLVVQIYSGIQRYTAVNELSKDVRWFHKPMFTDFTNQPKI
jgi:hypothetical protein